MLTRDPFDGEGALTEFSVWNQLNSMLGHHESEFEDKLNSLLDKLKAEEKRKLLQACEVLRNAIPRLFDVSQTLVAEGAEPALGVVRDALDTVGRAEAFFFACAGLGPKPAADPPPADKINEAAQLADLLNEMFQCQVAHEAIHEIPPAAQRALQLLRFAAEARPSLLAQRYLARVARCFTWGYEAETLILCRSVLEQVLEETVPDGDVFTAFAWNREAFPQVRRDKLTKRDPVLVAIGDRIHAACVLGKLTDEEVVFAKIIRDRGDKAVHDMPDAGADVRGTVEKLTHLVSKLCGEA